MNKLSIARCIGMLIALAAGQASGQMAPDPSNTFQARLIGARETPANSTPAKGTFQMTIAGDSSSFTYQLTFSDLAAEVTQAHIHFGQPSVAGGIMIWLCQTAAYPGPAGTPNCPAPGGTVTGMVNAVAVVGPSGQGISAGEFTKALDAVRMGLAYANVHSAKFPAGEIRGQIEY